MTTTELQMLATGFLLGTYLMIAVQVVFQNRDARRDTQAATAALAQARRRHATCDWREALVRRPTLVELVQAEVRDFELGLLDSVDRVEDAARREGLL
jgi:hypothetical protein